MFIYIKKGGVNNKIIKKTIPHRLKTQIQGDNNLVTFQANSNLGDITVIVYGDSNKITISEKCTVKNAVFWVEDNNCEIYIDENTTIESIDFGVSENNSIIYIGKDCMFSSGVKLKTGDSHSIIDMKSKLRINPSGNIHIGDHVWIGQEAIILKNAVIGNNSVVGTRALVSKKFDDNSLIAGMPARVIKENINWLRERI